MIELNKINKTFKGKATEFHCLKDITLSFDAGEFAVIAGPSGSGKTTLLNIMGLLDKPTSGNYRFDGQSMIDVNGRALAEMRLEKIGFVFQSYNLMPVLTAIENTEMILELRGISKSERRARATEVLNDLGMGEQVNQYPEELSGGQQQRVAIARAIVARPRLVIADEPTANLDSKTSDQLLSMMEKLNQQHKVSFVFSSHDPLVIQRAKRIIQLRDGTVVSDESAGLATKPAEQGRASHAAL